MSKLEVTRRAALAAAVLAPAMARAQAAGPKPHTIEELLREPEVLDAAISPDGEQLAVLHEQPKGDKRTALVLVNRLSALEEKPLIVTVGEYSVQQIEWAKNDRLLIWVTVKSDQHGREYGVKYGDTFVPIPLRRVISVGVGVGEPVLLFGEMKAVRYNFDAATVVDMMPHNPRKILMQSFDSNRDALNLYEVDVYSGAATVVEKGPPSTRRWIAQRGVPMLRFDTNYRGTVASIFGRAPGETEWKLIRKARRDERNKVPEFDVIGATGEPGVFLVARREDEEEHQAVRTYDIRTQAFGTPIGAKPGRDIESAVIDENLKLVATTSRDHRIEYGFTDPALGASYQLVSRALKDKVNVRLFDISTDHQRMLLSVSGPQEPGAFYVFDRGAKRLHLAAASRPWLDPERLARVEILKVRTRDGAEFPAYLTVPAGVAGARPLVVMPHGGPEVRDVYDFDLWAQVLAAQGWLVLQPNFRGSGGYGRSFAKLAHRNWGGRMQEDIDDAVAQVVTSGRVDPRRIAIFGGSYGGYAALMGAVRRSDLYRCAVSLAGVCDLADMLKFVREDGEDSPTFKYVVDQMGDPKTDAAMIRDASPRFQAARVGIPVLLMHGADDGIVPDRQSHFMAAALRGAGRLVEVKTYPGEGHSGWSRENTQDMLERTTAFIAKHI